MTRRPCPACRGTGLQHIRAGCAYVRCYICKGKGAILLSLPPVPSDVPSSGGNRPPEGGEKQIKSWIAPLVVVLALSLGCTFDLSQLRALPGGDAGADLVPADALVPAADLVRVLVADALPVLAPDALPALAPDALPALAPDALPVLAPDALPVYADCPDPPAGKSYTLEACPSVSSSVSCKRALFRTDGGYLVASLPSPCRRVLVLPASPGRYWYVTDCADCPPAGVAP